MNSRTGSINKERPYATVYAPKLGTAIDHFGKLAIEATSDIFQRIDNAVTRLGGANKIPLNAISAKIIDVLASSIQIIDESTASVLGNFIRSRKETGGNGYNAGRTMGRVLQLFGVPFEARVSYYIPYPEEQARTRVTKALNDRIALMNELASTGQSGNSKERVRLLKIQRTPEAFKVAVDEMIRKVFPLTRPENELSQSLIYQTEVQGGQEKRILRIDSSSDQKKTEDPPVPINDIMLISSTKKEEVCRVFEEIGKAEIIPSFIMVAPGTVNKAEGRNQMEEIARKLKKLPQRNSVGIALNEKEIFIMLMTPRQQEAYAKELQLKARLIKKYNLAPAQEFYMVQKEGMKLKDQGVLERVDFIDRCRKEFPRVLSQYFSWGFDHIIMTAGAKGASIFTKRGEAQYKHYHTPIFDKDRLTRIYEEVSGSGYGPTRDETGCGDTTTGTLTTILGLSMNDLNGGLHKFIKQVRYYKESPNSQLAVGGFNRWNELSDQFMPLTTRDQQIQFGLELSQRLSAVIYRNNFAHIGALQDQRIVNALVLDAYLDVVGGKSIVEIQTGNIPQNKAA